MSTRTEAKFSAMQPDMSVGAPSDYLLLQMKYKLLLEDYTSLTRQYEQMRVDYYKLCHAALISSEELFVTARAWDDYRSTNELYRKFVSGLFDLLDEATRTLGSDALRRYVRDVAQQFRARLALEALQESE